MTDSARGPDVSRQSGAGRIGWWLQLLQVRLRFVIVVAVAALLMTQWDRLQGSAARLWSGVSGQKLKSEIAADHEYFCPMDPGVLSAWPAICSICNMDLVPRKKGDAELLPEGVVARMQISPWRIQLAGLRTTRVVPCAAKRSLLLYGRWQHVPASDVARLRLPVARQDWPMFQQPVEVTIEGDRLPASMRGTAAALPEPGVTEPGAAVSQIEVLLHEVPGELAAGTYSLMVRAEVSAESALTAEQREVLGDRPLLQVPAAAVVDHGGTQLVYVQTMAGMFDGRVIVPGVRAGSVYPVLQGLEEGEQVVSTGAFLVDAEARLNPAMAVGYFGADQPALSSTSALAPLLDPISPKATRVLSAADREAASVQRNCPVTGLSLESMGGPVPVQVGDRRVFICCAACERKLLREPEKYLVKLPLGAASETRP